MGKKSKRKAAKAAAVAAGTSTGGSNNGQQLILGPRPDGIVCTNEDPNLCAVCCAVLPREVKSCIQRFCCGTWICLDCHSYGSCGFCQRSNGTAQQAAALIKKRAKEGFPWACHSLAGLFRGGMPPFFPQSGWEAVRWYEEAASKGNPNSYVYLAQLYTLGVGCKKDLEKASIMFEKAMGVLVEEFTLSDYTIWQTGYKLARALLEVGETDKGHSVLVPLAERGNGHAQSSLFEFHGRVGDLEEAMYWATVCSENPDDHFIALHISRCIGKSCLVRHWYSFASKNKVNSASEHKAELLKAHSMLCILRRDCAWCNANLDRSNRKMCKGCKAYCYCSEDCQRAHWNAVEDGHKSDCQKVMEVKKKVAAIKEN